MIHILGFIFIIIIAVLLIGLSLISMFLRGIFNLGRRAPSRTTASATGTNYSTGYGNPSATNFGNTTEHSTSRKKIFDKDDGEYVEFEEVR